MPDAMPDGTLAAAPPADPFAALEPLLRRQQGRPDSLIELLHRAQQLYGHLSQPLLRHVAGRLDLPLSRVYGTASFYHLFRFEPPARHSCVVCTGTACEVRGAAALVAALEAELALRLGERRADGSLSLGAVRCLGTCSAAPVVVIDGEVGRHQTVATVLERLRSLKP